MHPGTSIKIEFLGHSTVLMELDGVRVLTDPLLRGGVGPLRRHPPAHDPIGGPIDVVLISHAHRDHLDLPSLRLLEGAPRVVVPRGLGSLLRRSGVRNVEEVAAEARIDLGGGVEAVAFPALHDGSRPPFGPRADALGYVIEGSASAYFAGDTDLFPEMALLRDRIDVALLPVWGWGPRLGPGHLDPERAAEATAMIRPRLAVPIHWGTLYPVGMHRVWPDRLVAPPLEFARLVADADCPTEVRILSPGDWTTVSEERE
ncbi:MAG TPA: MBL fold metallo-hydrolase [Candidatus Saccharimonadales bacterium]|nr:MBL fold metallo-hydrolase [Candidatus Saccharimonadales bacterium]